jgi:hypothetical protein
MITNIHINVYTKKGRQDLIYFFNIHLSIKEVHRIVVYYLGFQFLVLFKTMCDLICVCLNLH